MENTKGANLRNIWDFLIILKILFPFFALFTNGLHIYHSAYLNYLYWILSSSTDINNFNTSSPCNFLHKHLISNY